MANLQNDINVQAAIAANTVRESYDSISNLIDTNLKKLDADVFTAHDNFAGNDLTTILNSQKNATEFHDKVAGVTGGNIIAPENLISNNYQNISQLKQAIPEANFRNESGNFPHSANLDSNSVRNNTAAPQINNSLKEIFHNNSSEHLTDNNHETNTYHNLGRDSDSADTRDGRDGKNGKDGKDGVDCGCGSGGHHCGMENHGNHNHGDPRHPQHHGHEPHHQHHHDHKPDHQHHQHGGEDCDPKPHQPPVWHTPHLPPLNLLNVDILGHLGGGLLHGHLGDAHNPLINIIAGGNLLGGANNQSPSYGKLIDVVTNGNILNHDKNSALLSNTTVGILRGEHNTPLLELGLNGDVLHNSGNLLDVNLVTEHWGKEGPGLGANVVELKNLSEEKLAVLAEKALNGSSDLSKKIESLLQMEMDDGSNPAQPIMQVGIALAAIGTTIISSTAHGLHDVVNVATGEFGQLANGNLVSNLIPNNIPLSGLPNDDLSGITNNLNSNIGNITGNLNANLSNVTGTLGGDINNVHGAINGNAGSILNSGSGLTNSVANELNHDLGGVNSNVGNVASTLANDSHSIAGNLGDGISGLANSVMNLEDGLLHNIGSTLSSDIGSIGSSVMTNVSNIGSALSHDLGSIAGSVTSNLQSISGSLTGALSGNGIANVNLSPSIISVSVPNLADLHLGSGGANISLPVLTNSVSAGGVFQVSLAGGLDTHNSLSNLDPLSPFADHNGGSLTDIAHGIGGVADGLNHVTTIVHDVTTDHHPVTLLHGHG